MRCSSCFHHLDFLLCRRRLIERLLSGRWLSHRAAESLRRSHSGGGGTGGGRIGIDEDRHDAVAGRHDTITIRIIVVLLRRLVIFLVKVQNRSVFFFALNAAARLIAPVIAILYPIAHPLIGNAFLVRHAFELIVVAKLAVFLVVAGWAIANIIASN